MPERSPKMKIDLIEPKIGATLPRDGRKSDSLPCRVRFPASNECLKMKLVSVAEASV
jgi:hypothetical protein